MKFSFLAFLLAISVSALAGDLQSVPVREIAAEMDQPVDLTPQVGISLQPSESAQFSAFEFTTNSKPEIQVPYTSKALWIQFQLSNPGTVPIDKFIYFTSALTGVLELYSSKSQTALQTTGSSIPYSQRSYRARLPAFKVQIPPGETETFYVKRVSHHNLATKVLLGSPAVLLHDEMNSKSILFFYVGGIVCLIVYNLFIGIYARDLNYFFYAFFAASVAAAALNTQGFFDTFIFPDMSFSFSHYLMTFSSIAVLSCLLFGYRFLNIPQTFPKSKIGFLLLGASGLTTFVLGFFPQFTNQVIFGHMIDLTIFVLLIFMVTCGVMVYRNGYKLAQFFLLSWISLVSGVICWFGMTYGFLHNSSFTSNALIFGNLGEMLVLSLGLAYKINILDQEKRKAMIEAQDKERYHRLVKVLSHDISNAVSIFSGYLLRLKKNLQTPQEAKTVEKLQGVVENVRDMLNLVRDEEAFNSFRISVALRPVDLGEVVHEVVAFYDDLISKKNLQLKVRIPDNSFVLADKTALANQVFSNLLSNAIKFSYPDSEILISVEKGENCTVVKIEDCGMGMQPDFIDRIFFSREVTSKHGTLKEKGSGLGTSLVKDYMKIFKGRIEVRSIHESASQDSGTCISLFFPAFKSENFLNQ